MFKTSPRFRRWLAGAFLLSVLYPLSLGPGVWVAVYVLPDFAVPAVRVFYAPLVAIVARSPILLSVAVAYQELWVDQAELQRRFSQQ